MKTRARGRGIKMIQTTFTERLEAEVKRRVEEFKAQFDAEERRKLRIYWSFLCLLAAICGGIAGWCLNSLVG